MSPWLDLELAGGSMHDRRSRGPVAGGQECVWSRAWDRVTAWPLARAGGRVMVGVVDRRRIEGGS